MFKDLKIGYVPFSQNLTAPGDRRRFSYYANARDIKFEIANPNEKYDLLVLSTFADISVWSRYQNGQTKIVYDLIDSYLAIPPNDLKAIFRGAAKFLIRQNKHLEVNYRQAIIKMCQRADAVVCTTVEQRQDILPYCDNVHIILDIHSGAVKTVKSDYAAGKTFNLVWEGMGVGIHTLFEIKEVLKRLNIKRNIALHIITDLEFRRYLAKYMKRDTRKIALKIFDNTYLYQWNEDLIAPIITACDLAFIPIPLENPLYTGKPENKLLLFWRMGMPTIVSATPSYSKAMQQCGLSMFCASNQEWEETMEFYMANEAARREAGYRGRVFAESVYGESNTLSRWDDVFKSVLIRQQNAGIV